MGWILGLLGFVGSAFSTGFAIHQSIQAKKAAEAQGAFTAEQRRRLGAEEMGDLQLGIALSGVEASDLNPPSGPLGEGDRALPRGALTRRGNTMAIDSMSSTRGAGRSPSDREGSLFGGNLPIEGEPDFEGFDRYVGRGGPAGDNRGDQTNTADLILIQSRDAIDADIRAAKSNASGIAQAYRTQAFMQGLTGFSNLTGMLARGAAALEQAKTANPGMAQNSFWENMKIFWGAVA